MNQYKKSRNWSRLFIIFLLAVSLVAQSIPFARMAESETLWCNSFDSTYTEWEEKNAPPYLHDTDTDLVKAKTIGITEGNFEFSDSSSSGTINSVTLYMEGKGSGYELEIYVFDGYSFTNEGNLVFEGAWLYKTLDLSSKLDTWIKINSAEIYITCIKADGKDLQIRRAYLYIDYESEPPPPPPSPDSEGDYIDSWDISSESDDALSITTDGTNIWILDYIDDEVYKYSMAGVYVDSWDTGDADDAFGITTDGSNIWIADYGTSEVYKYTMAGVYVDSWDTSSQSTYLYGVATDGNYIWLLDYGDAEVYKYSMAGVYTDDHWDTSSQTWDGCDLTTDGDYIRVVSPDDAEVYKYNMSGNYISSWDTSIQSGDGYGITTDGTNIWIVDYADTEVYKYEGPTPEIEAPSDPELLFGAGFNASSPYVELHWNHTLLDVQFFEVQNSSDCVSWTYLGQSTTANYTDTQVVNGTERYYKVRACNQTGASWYNSSFTSLNFETVYFILGDGPPADEALPVDDYSMIFLAMGLIFCLAIYFLYTKYK